MDFCLLITSYFAICRHHSNPTTSRDIAKRIFDVFDQNHDGRVDFPEFVAGLSLLCRASTDTDRVKATFALFDIDGDGVISLDEMERYLVTFFQIYFALEPERKKRFGTASAKDVGMATAQHCFQLADQDDDGRITFEEFKIWYASDDAWAQSSIMPR